MGQGIGVCECWGSSMKGLKLEHCGGLIVMICGGLWWFSHGGLIVMVHGGSWWFNCHGLWWFMVV